MVFLITPLEIKSIQCNNIHCFVDHSEIKSAVNCGFTSLPTWCQTRCETPSLEDKMVLRLASNKVEYSMRKCTSALRVRKKLLFLFHASPFICRSERQKTGIADTRGALVLAFVRSGARLCAPRLFPCSPARNVNSGGKTGLKLRTHP